jgi:hypothetical protein
MITGSRSSYGYVTLAANIAVAEVVVCARFRRRRLSCHRHARPTLRRWRRLQLQDGDGEVRGARRWMSPAINGTADSSVG